MITSQSLRKISDVVIDPFFYNSDYEFNCAIHTNLCDKLVFVNGDIIENVIGFLKQFKNMKMIIHGTDRTVDFLLIKALLKNCDVIYAVNCSYINDNVKQIPLGFQDVNTRHLVHHNKRPFNEKDYNVDKTKSKLCYMNFNVYNTDELKFQLVKTTRRECYETFKDKKWVEGDESKLEYEEFIKKLATYKFAICPPGFGIDTHRFYECAIINTRPIILSSPLDGMYACFNPLIVNDWSEVTEELLNSQPEYNINTKFFQLEYWINSP